MPFLARKPRLLLLDDDPSMQRLVSAMLKKEGYRVDVVSSGAQAIENVRANEYDALLLDVMTPTEGGLTVIRYLRKANAAMLKRIVLVTASPQSVLHAVEKEVFAIVHKPFEAKELVSTVKRITT
ncbi:MAG TPA: response regulator [Thermoanaerobaculia bacterium]|nr:response regulator [Thermoanaerobaculia bacterium]